LESVEHRGQFAHERCGLFGAAMKIEARQTQIVGQFVEALPEREVIAGLRLVGFARRAHADARANLRRHPGSRVENEGAGKSDALAVALTHEHLPVGAELMDDPALYLPTIALSV
jgi:hypothetical protein